MPDLIGNTSSTGTAEPEKPQKPKTNWTKVVIRNSIILVIITYFINSGFSDFQAPKKVLEILKNRYNTEFEFKAWKNSKMTRVSPRIGEVVLKSDPRTAVTVRVYPADGFGQYRVIDDYYTKIMEEESRSIVTKMIQSKYASKTLVDISADTSNWDGGYDGLIRQYNLDQIRIGPSTAPEAYKQMGVGITLFVPGKDQENAIRELYGYYHKLVDIFGGDSVFVSVCDEKYLRIEPLKAAIENGDEVAMKRFMTDMDVDGKLWCFWSNEKYNMMSDKALMDYSYFRNANTDYNKQVKKEFEEGEEWNKKQHTNNANVN
jgi:hypothetical protein